MKQTINLLYDDGQPSSNVKRMVIVLIAAVTVMVLTAFGLWLATVIRDNRIETLQSDFQEKIKSKVHVESADKVLAQEKDELKLQLKIQSATIELLKKRRRTPVAEALVSLAQSDVEGLWFDHMSFDNDPFRLDLSGESKSPEILVKMMTSLKERSLYDGVAFSQLQVKFEREGVYRFRVMGAREK